MKILKFGNVTMRGDDLYVSDFTFDCEGKSYNYNERNIAAMEAIIAFLAAKLSLMPPPIDYANMEACCFKTDAVDAIAPPVAAGSVDTMQRYDLTMSWGETVMEDCTSGDWVRHDDAIAWNAQECERAKNASSNCIKINEELIQEQRRAEKAELLLSSVAALAHKWNKDAVKDGFAASEAGLDLLELMGWPKV